ncbi:ribose-5-phosphate isomerase A [Leuconostoc litchii]|uniref:Ribose-5-phosphate isomerase A n=1 Tax=Leuconostoc litchii TaxID=1981069 RepID=A0A6P2CPI8_9LACO|nr:ribose-5-phosphate isomerase RpiA [Leuconostoc litchii]TYC47303.1 ribose-5-phosphate isomerase RpiA [Leuconostoc litchii]GMA69296.1 ribose-5-phosphate isomerase A [Leuconostoc litchii]
MNNSKKNAGEYAATLVKDGMIVGLGTGSTVAYFLDELSRRIKYEKLSIIGVTTSTKTAERAQELGIPIRDIDSVLKIDLTIDGADEVDCYMNGIKGGGAAFLMEKIVAKYSKRVVWIIDEQKLHKTLGQFSLPVEVVPFGNGQLIHELTQHHLYPKLRLNTQKQPIVTDLGHYIVDLDLKQIDQPYELAQYLDSQIGVVEHGLFLDIADEVIIGQDDGYRVMNKLQKKM